MATRHTRTTVMATQSQRSFDNIRICGQLRVLQTLEYSDNLPSDLPRWQRVISEHNHDNIRLCNSIYARYSTCKPFVRQLEPVFEHLYRQPYSTPNKLRCDSLYFIRLPLRRRIYNHTGYGTTACTRSDEHLPFLSICQPYDGTSITFPDLPAV